MENNKPMPDATTPETEQLRQQLADMKAEMDSYKEELKSLRSHLNLVIGREINVENLAQKSTSRRRLLKQMAAGAAGIGAISIVTTLNPQNALAETAGDTALEAAAGPSGYGGKFVSNFAQARLVPATTAGAPVLTNHKAGELFVDQVGDLYFATGDPASTNQERAATSWRKIVGPSTAGAFQLLNPPSRFIDTRALPFGINDVNNPFSHNTLRIYNFLTLVGRGGASLPSNTKGIVGNVTVVSSSAGFLRISPVALDPVNDPSTLNFSGGAGTGNNFSALLSDSGTVVVYVYLYTPTNNSAQVIIDITGYYA
jgi:hypothetical protein